MMNMHIGRTLVAVTLAAAMMMPLVAEDASQSDDLSFDESGDTGFSSFSDDSSDSESTPLLTFGGVAKANARVYVDQDGNAPFSADPSLLLTLSHEGSALDFEGKLKLDLSTIKSYPEDVLEEMTVRAYLGDFVLEGGKMKVVWGKGDKIHVLDNFNSDDYTDFLIPDYIDRRLAVPMVRLSYNSAKDIHVEGIYTPYMVPDRFATTGLWTPDAYTSTVSAVTVLATNQAASQYATTYSQMIAAGKSAVEAEAIASLQQTSYLSSVSSQSGLYADTKSGKYGQFGLRTTGTIGSFDWGASYFYGRRKQPSLNQQALQAWVQSPTTASYALDYDRLQVFGLEGATAIGPVNLRFEAAYDLTDDIDGTDPYVHNNSLGWVFGFDVGLPISNMSINLQTIGTYVLKNDKIASAADVDYLSSGVYTNDKLVLSLTDNYFHEKLAAECNVIWGIERKDLVIMPKLTYTLTEGLNATLSGMYIVCDDDGEFAAYKKNSFVQAGLTYTF